MAIAIGDLKRFVETDKAAERALRHLVGRLAHQQYVRLGWKQKTGESEEDTRLRPLIISSMLMLYSEEAAVIATALECYAAATPEQLDPELRSVILGAAVRYGDGKTAVKQLLALYRETASPELQGDIAGAVNFLRDTTKGRYVTTLPKADALVPCVSAASIVAKVARDRYMTMLGEQFPQYGFARHVGYGTVQHRAAIARFGVMSEHRLSFAPLKRYHRAAVDGVE